MAVHKIKAKDDPVADKSPAKVAKQPPTKPKPAPKKSKKTAKPPKNPHSLPVRILLLPFRPLFALGRYFRDAWREIRLVQWPNRKFTWKMTLAVVVFVAFFAVLIALLDILFSLIFNNLIQ